MDSRNGEINEDLSVVFDSPVEGIGLIGIIKKVHQLLVIRKE